MKKSDENIAFTKGCPILQKKTACTAAGVHDTGKAAPGRQNTAAPAPPLHIGKRSEKLLGAVGCTACFQVAGLFSAAA